MGGRFFGPGWHGGFQLFGGLFGIVLFALFIGLLVWALMRLMNHDHARHAPVGRPWQARDEALNAARMRYARSTVTSTSGWSTTCPAFPPRLTPRPRPPPPAPRYRPTP